MTRQAEQMAFLGAMKESLRAAQRAYGEYNARVFPPRPAEFFALELAGETGELANKEKKRWTGREVPDAELAEEAADVFIALVNYCNARGIDLGAAAGEKMLEIEARRVTRLASPRGDKA